MARTMSDEQELEDRQQASMSWNGPVSISLGARLKRAHAELDAERAAHEATKERLALAEDVCGAFDDYRRSEGGALSFQNTFDAHDKWRAAK